MTVLTVTLPDAATAEVIEHIRRVGGTVTPGPAAEPQPEADFGAKFHWDESLELTKEVGGTPLSQLVIEERQNNWR